MLVSWDTKFSFSLCSMRGSRRIIYFRKKTSIGQHIHVFYLKNMLRRLLYNCIGAIRFSWLQAPITTRKFKGISFYDECLFTCKIQPKGISVYIIIMCCWNLWIPRNGKIFKNAPKSIQSPWNKLKVGHLLVRPRAKHKNCDIWWHGGNPNLELLLCSPSFFFFLILFSFM